MQGGRPPQAPSPVDYAFITECHWWFWLITHQTLQLIPKSSSNIFIWSLLSTGGVCNPKRTGESLLLAVTLHQVKGSRFVCHQWKECHLKASFKWCFCLFLLPIHLWNYCIFFRFSLPFYSFQDCPFELCSYVSSWSLQGLSLPSQSR